MVSIDFCIQHLAVEAWTPFFNMFILHETGLVDLGELMIPGQGSCASPTQL
jgi:hypothetical protein